MTFVANGQFGGGTIAGRYRIPISSSPDPTPEDEAEYITYASTFPEMDMTGMASGAGLIEMQQTVAIFPRNSYDKIAVADGNWADGATWDTDTVPVAGDRVLIGKDKTVTYNQNSTAAIEAIRVDGTLTWDRTTTTHLVVDTIIVDPGGVLDMGTEASPITNANPATVVFPGTTDLDQTYDMLNQGRGILALGNWRVWGAARAGWVRAAENLTTTGQTSVDVKEEPVGWQVGDTIILHGTYKQQWTSALGSGYIDPEDDITTIASITDNMDGTWTIGLDDATTYRHCPNVLDGADPEYPADPDDVQPGEMMLPTWPISNMTRSITFSTPDGAEKWRRGHCLTMYGANDPIKYAAFVGLGRTDKNGDSFTAADEWDGVNPVANDGSISWKGRYPLHLHRTGSFAADPIEIVGNVAWGAPGWGISQHTGGATVTDNVAYDVFGSGFMAEDGAEWGVWRDNLAATCRGQSGSRVSHTKEKAGSDSTRNDSGKHGSGFWFHSRSVDVTGCFAINCPHGYVWVSRNVKSNPPLARTYPSDAPTGMSRIWRYRDSVPAATVRSDRSIIRRFDDNEAGCCEYGVIIMKDAPDQDHDARSVFHNFLAWETIRGGNFSYTGHYSQYDFQSYGMREQTKYAGKTYGFALEFLAVDVIMIRPRVRQFPNNYSEGAVYADIREDALRDRLHKIIDGEATNPDGVPGITYPVYTNNPITSEDELLICESLDSGTDVDTAQLPEFTPDTWYCKTSPVRFDLEGTKTDSLGTNRRWFGDYGEASSKEDISGQNIDSTELELILRNTGFWETPLGVRCMKVEDYVQDRFYIADGGRHPRVALLDYPIVVPSSLEYLCDDGTATDNGALSSWWSGWTEPPG